VIESDLSPDKLQFIDDTAVRSVKNDILWYFKKEKLKYRIENQFSKIKSLLFRVSES
jgi:hypothetical protein